MNNIINPLQIIVKCQLKLQASCYVAWLLATRFSIKEESWLEQPGYDKDEQHAAFV